MDTTHTDLNTMKVKCNIRGIWVMLVSFYGNRIKHNHICNLSILNLERGSIKKLFLAFILMILTGCDFASQSLSVREDSSKNIRIVHLTLETVLEANKLSYKPQKWPDVFSSIEESRLVEQNKFIAKQTVLEPQRLSGVIEWRLPPSSQSQPYLIGVGDVIIFSTPIAHGLINALDGLIVPKNIRQGYTVQGDGVVSIPDIGRVVIGGLTLEEAEDAFYRQLVEVGIAPSFSIEISEFNSQKVFVSGNVVSPGIEPIAMQPLYLDQVIYRRGGINIGDASYVIIRLYRNGSIYQISGPELHNHNGANRILLKDGDRVVVDMTDEYENAIGLRQQARAKMLRELEMETEAKSNQAESILSRLEYGSIRREYVYLIGEVQLQSRFTLPFENQAFLADALLESGGGVLSFSGNPKQIYVLRGASDTKNFESITAYHLDVTNAANFLLATRLELRPKDVIFVGTQPITNWNRIISQIIPSLGLSNLNVPFTK